MQATLSDELLLEHYAPTGLGAGEELVEAAHLRCAGSARLDQRAPQQHATDPGCT